VGEGLLAGVEDDRHATPASNTRARSINGAPRRGLETTDALTMFLLTGPPYLDVPVDWPGEIDDLSRGASSCRAATDASIEGRGRIMWHKRSPWRGLALLSTGALLTVLVRSAVATPQTWLAQSRGVYQTTVVTSGLAVQGGGYTDVSGATTTIRVPGSWRSGVVLVRFTA